MRLRYQLMLGFLSCLIPAMLLLLLLSVQNTRHYQSQQLAIHAQDTATSLGLSLTAVLPNDLAMADTMINAIFDSGFYRHMQLTDIDGKVLIERDNPEQVEGVPLWFMRLFPFDPPQARSEISSGWQQIAVLTVDSHPGIGYRRLWSTAVWLGASVLVASLLVMGVIYGLLRVILTPLHAIERQARKLSQGQFVTVERVPKTPELAHVVRALNRMSRTLGNQFQQLATRADQLRETAYLDEDTGLGNLEQAKAQINQVLSDPEGPGFGYLLLVELSSQRDIQDRDGETQAVQELRTLVAIIQHELKTFPSSQLYRVRDTELLLLLPFTHRPEVKALGDAVAEAFAAHQSLLHPNGVGYLAGCVFRHGESFGELKKRLEAALSVAHQEKPNSCYIPPSGEALPSVDELSPEGMTELLQVDRLLLHRQPLVDASTRNIIGYELLPRFIGERGQHLPTGQVVGMAEKLHQVEQLDRLVIREGLSWLSQNLSENQSPTWYSLNVSIHSLQSAHFLRWLRSELQSVPGLLSYIRLELHETGLLQDLSVAESFIQQMRKLGVSCVIDRFGINLASFTYLKQLRPDAIKVDGSHIRGIDQDWGNQMFLQVLIQLSAGLEIEVIAGQVETAEEWHKLSELGIDIGQGYFLGKPSACDEQ